MIRLPFMAAALLVAACGSSAPPQSSGAGNGGETAACPASQPAPPSLPGIEPKHRQASYWIGRSEKPDAVLLTAAEIADHDAALAAHDAAHPDEDPRAPYDLTRPEDPARLAREIDERLTYLRERVADGRYVDGEGQRVATSGFDGATPPIGDREVRVALAAIPIRCGPRRDPLYKAPDIDPAFDRNACSTLRVQEPVAILATWPGGMKLVRSRYALGFIAPDAPLSPPLDADDRAAFAAHESFRVAEATELAGIAIPAHARLARRGDEALVATASGVKTVAPPPGAVASARPLTRRALYEEAFRFLDSPYGWGGQNGGRDCSRFLLDVFASFGLGLPRHSAQQAQAGSWQIDLSAASSERERLGVIDAAARRGVVMLHFPGHIMLYLGRADDGRPMAIHAFAEYLERCETGETRRTVDRVHVSDLTLGAGTSRRSFLERITHVTVLGATPGPELAGAAVRRPPAPMRAPAPDCAGEAAIFTSPRRPHPGAPLRVVVTAERDLGAVELAFFDPEGKRHTPPLHRLGGPPFGYWAEIAAPTEGRYTLQIGEGSRVMGCERVTVHARGDQRQAAGGSVWHPQRAWSAEMERLYAAFVEQLFAHPLDDRTWPSLSALLTDRDHNLLHDHLGQGEEGVLALKPDCADLPYFLRAYFAWKLRLPFAYRHCNRGSSGKAPYCDRDLKTHLDPIEDASSATRAFFEFARRNVADGVHSGSGRTAPEDEHSDYYPLPLTREAIRPGVIFADPYGHLFVIAAWIPQGIGRHGILVGADAQPDGTIGRRRFWPGSFLFTPDTKEAGAGFKAFRPVRYRGGTMRAVKNADIGSIEGLPPFSLEQYEGSARDFYDRVEALINPRPLDPRATLDVLIDALHEQVKRRVVSVQNAEDYKASHRGAIEMPTGHSIFETSGPWEDFSTPSRDMRLLIAVDTVVGFVEAVKRNPARFGVDAAEVEVVAAELKRHLDAELARRDFAYEKSDGSMQALTVADVIARARDFELAYNPNDCVEIRWAAPAESQEQATCKHRAPAHQRERMESYRSWFSTRRRPAR